MYIHVQQITSLAWLYKAYTLIAIDQLKHDNVIQSSKND